MKKIFITIPFLLLMFGCSNRLEEEKDEYLTYKNDLQEQKNFQEDDELDFNTFFNIVRVNEEKINYSIIIDNPKINMYNVKALLIHDFMTEDAYPSVGIFDDPVNLLNDSDSKITLNGSIQTIKDVSKVKFKLYLEYEDEKGVENKIYYEVARG